MLRPNDDMCFVRSNVMRSTNTTRLIHVALCSGLLMSIGCNASEDSGAAGNPVMVTGGTMAAGQGGASGAAGIGGAGAVGGASGIGGGAVGGAAGNAGAAGAAGTSPPAPGRPSEGSMPLPCDVDEAVKRNCQSCHAAQPLAGVPMALITWEDFQLPSVSNPALKVHELVAMRVHDTAAPMPPPPQVMPDADKAAITAWLTSGAAVGTEPMCREPEPELMWPPIDLGECYELRAHDPLGAGPYTAGNEHYVNFYFDAPWPAGAHGIRFETILGDHPEVLHHWLLYTVGGSGFFPPDQPSGTVEAGSNGSHFSATLVAGWAPGGDSGMNVPLDVGMDISGARNKLVLEIHFYTNTAVQTDAGVRVCTARAPRANTATVSWLGTESISVPAGQMRDVSGQCAPSTSEPIHILRSWPHMHQLGRHMKTVIDRAGGGTETLVDEPFNFNTQYSYNTPTTIMPGDTLTTTCTFQNDTPGDVGYGMRTTDEMCFNFVTAWPAGALVAGRAMNGAENPCMN